MKTNLFKFRKGFTLVETVVVVMVLGFLISYIASSLINFIRPSVADTVEKFRQSLTFCYRSAMLHNEAVLVKIDLDEQTYTAFRVSRTEDGITEKKILQSSFTSNSKIREVIDIRGVVFETGEVIVPFTYTGVSEDYSFHFGDDNTTHKTLLLYRYNGKMLVKSGEVTRKARDEKNQKTELNEDEEF